MKRCNDTGEGVQRKIWMGIRCGESVGGRSQGLESEEKPRTGAWLRQAGDPLRGKLLRLYGRDSS